MKIMAVDGFSGTFLDTIVTFFYNAPIHFAYYFGIVLATWSCSLRCILWTQGTHSCRSTLSTYIRGLKPFYGQYYYV